MVSRARSERARTNDTAIRLATIELILRSGIDAISFRDVGKAAGLTHGALYARFEDVEELLVDLWNSVLAQRVSSLFEAVERATTAPSEESVSAVLQRVRDAEQSDVAAVQVLLLSRRFVILREDVERFLHDYLEESRSRLGNAIWSRTMVLFSLIMVKIFSNSEFGLNHERINFMQPVLIAALKIEPNDVATFDHGEPFDRPDRPLRNDLQSQLAYSTYRAVGMSGYTKATISRISRRANCSPGAIYKLFPAKEDLVIFAWRRMMEDAALSPSRVAFVLDEGVLARSLHSAASSQNDLRKFFVMEMLMASAQNEKLRNAVGEQMLRIEDLALTLHDIPDQERLHVTFMLREVTLLTLGAAFLSTMTPVVNEINFSQFSEPFRRALQDCCFPSWSTIRSQLQAHG